MIIKNLSSYLWAWGILSFREGKGYAVFIEALEAVEGVEPVDRWHVLLKEISYYLFVVNVF